MLGGGRHAPPDDRHVPIVSGAIAFALTVVGAPGAARGETSDEPVNSPTPAFFDVNKYRADPNNPGAIHVPGTNVALYIGGFAQLDYISDIQVIGNPDQFVVASVPVGGGTGNTGSELSVRQTRVFLETDAPWDVAPLLAYVEVDFFDPQNDSNLHIRHAFGAFGHPDGVRLVAGYTWTSFMDATVIPSQLDYAGPVGLANVQQAQARLVVPFLQTRGPNGEHWGLEWTLSVDAPDPQVTTPMNVQGTGYARWPDTITALRWNHAHGHLQASALFRQVGIFPSTGPRVAEIGYGGNFTGGLGGFWGKDQLLWAVGGGRGVAHYFAGSNGLSLDGFLQPAGDAVPDQPRRRPAVVPALLRRSVLGQRDREHPSSVQSRGRRGHDAGAARVFRGRLPVHAEPAPDVRRRIPLRAAREPER